MHPERAPWAYRQEGRNLLLGYFGDAYPVEPAGIGYTPPCDPENLKPRT